MILPTKGIDRNRALLSLGADCLRLLNKPKTVSRVWEELQQDWKHREVQAALGFDWFVLALDMLFSIGAIDLTGGLLRRRQT